MKSAKVPEYVYANNGARYHPCHYCCRAFAHKRYLTLHMKACIRTHLHADDNKPSVSVFPSPTRKSNSKPATSSSGIGIRLSDEITIEKRPKLEKESVVHVESGGEGSSGYDDEIEEEFDERAASNTVDDDITHVNKKSKKFSMANACKLCDEIFSSLDELIMHAKIEHNQRTKDNKKFSPEDIEYFLKVFTKMNKSHCPICRKAILNTLNWKGHLYTHCSVRNFVCKVCGKCFTRGDHCKYHELRHKHATETQEEDQ